MKKILFVPCLILLVSGCARSPIKEDSQAMRLIEKPPTVLDDLDYAYLKQAVSANIEQLEKKSTQELQFGPLKIEKDHYLMGLRSLEKQLGKLKPNELSQFIEAHYDFYEVYGGREWGEVFITSYYDPVIQGSMWRTEKYSQPLYARPKDLVSVNIAEFAKRLPVFEPMKDKVLEQKSRDAIARGRLVLREDRDPLVIPFYDRQEIDQKKSPIDRRMVLAWVDPIEAFFLQIQGSGTVQLPKGRQLRLTYDSQNGHPYVPIGRFLLDVIPKDEMSLQKIESHLRTLPMEQQQEILNKNPSYVFFRKAKGGSVTFFGSEVVPGRTIATDYRYFPKGALAFLEFAKPVFTDAAATAPTEWLPSARLVIDQDTGGAIRGPHRVDLYWGKGAEAKQTAGVMKNYGRLYYLVPKTKWIERLQAKDSPDGKKQTQL